MNSQRPEAVTSRPVWEGAWRELIAWARRTAADGLVVGTSGNLSVRVGDAVLVTPTAVPYEDLGPADLLAVGLDGRRLAGTLAPTSELPLHLAVYRSTGARAVVHTHAVHATAVSTLVDELPPIHYLTGLFGGPVRVADYAPYGSQELAAHALTALRERTGCLLRNHGTLVHAAGLRQAFEHTAQLEWLCRLWLAASSVPGRAPALLSPEQIAAATERLGTYRQP
ncbi:class II aldolase/adducin family protein [Streptomyces sp. DSM 44917]|uniref:Class II aldolase/adducin family protein n=1 Tax=Streptomyces boetiae TaxID=3075541 RepID=A0ABU2L5G4_9ACTN|nr:class II aldolase/adducin family protein [Streptomyces sp. DSM 44917]MDT0306794.1 class II aldolase/adducin family protein [Streptomyces sp. DSM 44917]